MSNATLAALRDRLSDTSCSMKRCRDCDEWKPADEFYLRRSGTSHFSYCKLCSADRWRERNQRQKIERSGSAFAHRLPEDTVSDYVQHALPYWIERKLPLVKLIVSNAPKTMRSAIKRELAAIPRAA